MILGKKFTVPVEKMADIDFEDNLTLDKNRHGYEGEIFNFESRELRNEKQLLEFAVSDHTGSISCKIFAGKNADALKDRLKNGTWVHIEGTIAYDEYAHEKLLSPKVIEEMDESERPKRTDDAPEKRVELHMHSQYSAMDAVSKVKKIVAQAKDFGHDIIGITDHGVVQAYPEIMKETKGTGIKVLYGLEGYLVNDGVKITTGDQDEPFDGEFVFFDLETTGLYPGRDAIIEIAAARIKNKHILDTFQTFVNPHRKVPAKITELTSITDQMVAGGLEEEEALRKFLEYADGRILVAHNANFDMGFLSLAMAKYQIPNGITYIDTLAMARTLIPSIARHNLKKLASYFKIDMGHHHRAIDDAVCSAKIFVRLMALAEEKEVHTSMALNSLIDLQQVIKTERPYHIIIYAKDQEGLIDLYRLVSASHVEYFYKKPRLPKSLLAAHREHLLIGSACEAGELYTAIKENVPKHKLDQIADFYDYFEVQPLGNNAFMERNGDLTHDDLIQINKAIIALGREKHKLVVATGDVHYVSPEDAAFRAILQAGQGYKDADHQPPLYYHSTAEMLDEFNYLDPEEAYELVVTTWGGLYRYEMKDVVRVTGFVGNTPMIEFQYKSIEVLNMVDEKIPAAVLNDLIRQFFAEKGISIRQLQVYQNESEKRYDIYIEPVEGHLPIGAQTNQDIDHLLAHHFTGFNLFRNEMRVMNQPQVIEMPQGWQQSLYAKAAKKAGMTSGQMKLTLIAKEQQKV